MFFDWEIQLQQIQPTGDLEDDIVIYQGNRLPCYNDQRFCEPTIRTQATVIWLPEDTCTTFRYSKIQARMVEFYTNSS